MAQRKKPFENFICAIHWLKGYRLFILVVILFLCLAISLSITGPRGEIATNKPDQSSDTVIEHKSHKWYSKHTYSDGRNIPLNTVNTGVYLEKLYSLDLAQNSFRARGYIWSKWSGKLIGWDKKPWSKQDPLDGLYMNTLNKHDSSLDGDDTPFKSDHGWSYTSRLFDAEFESSFNFKKYPFDRQRITLLFFQDGDAAITRNFIDKDSKLDAKADSFKEYKVKKVKFSDMVYEYPTRFGFTDYDKHEKQNYSVSAVKVDLYLTRSLISGFWKEILPPMLASMLLLVNTISPWKGWEEPKAAIPPAVLLSLIFLHQGYQGRLPTLDYLTFMDIFYVLLYTLTIYMAVEVIVCNSVKTASTQAKIKRISQMIFLLFTVILPLAAWFTI
jgi:hypothetical protein